ncbi:MAG: hypothetical protein IKC65_05370 [Lentisphaeria bacterium]|nr:hypothetical protein [Lentisphaeria bacterium]
MMVSYLYRMTLITVSIGVLLNILNSDPGKSVFIGCVLPDAVVYYDKISQEVFPENLGGMNSLKATKERQRKCQKTNEIISEIIRRLPVPGKTITNKKKGKKDHARRIARSSNPNL